MRLARSFGLATWVGVLCAGVALTHCGERGLVPGEGGAGGEPGDGASHELGWSGALPDGFYNIDYSAALEVEGAHGEPTFELIDGELPAGLTLSAAGVLSGRPSEEGTFPITIGVVDDEGASLEIEVEVTIRRKRWLAYVSQENVDARHELRFVDISQAVPVVSLVSTGGKSFTTISHTAFSPDGRRLVYTADKSVDAEESLYLIDLSSGAPKGDRVISGAAVVRDLAWSADSRYLAYWDSLASRVQVLDFETDLSESLEVGESNAGALSWIGSRLAFSTSSGLGVVSIEDGSSSLVESFASSEERVHDTNVEAGLASVKSDDCCSFCAETSSLLDLGVGKLTAGPRSATRYSPNLDFVAYVGAEQFRVFAADDYDAATPLASVAVPNGACNGIWSPDSKWFVTVNADAKLEVLSPDGKPNQVLPVDGVSLVNWTKFGDLVGNNPYDGFSPDGRWFRFRSGSPSKSYLSSVEKDGWSAPAIVSPAPASVTGVFSPDSRVLIMWETMPGGGTAFRVVDTSGDEIGASEVVLSAATGQGEYDLGGSSPWLAPRVTGDSSAFVYLFSEDGESAKNLYVFDLLDEGATGRQISNLLCPPSEACHAIVDVVLQP